MKETQRMVFSSLISQYMFIISAGRDLILLDDTSKTKGNKGRDNMLSYAFRFL